MKSAFSSLLTDLAGTFRLRTRTHGIFYVGDPALDHYIDGHLCPYAVGGVILVNPGECACAL